MASTVTPQRTQTPDDEADKEMVKYAEEGIEEVPVDVDWEHEHILHPVGSLPKATGSISQPLQHLLLQPNSKQPWNTTLSSGPKTSNSSN